MEVILLRHSIAQGNQERRFVGRSDVPLTPEGTELAQKTALLLPQVEHVYRSPLLRCAETARLLWPDVEETSIDALREADFGPFEGKTHEELKDDPLYQKWLSAPETFPLGESPEDARMRACAGWKRMLDSAKAYRFRRVGVVTHGGTIMDLLWTYGRPARASYYDWKCANCGGFRVSTGENPVTLTVLERIGDEVP